MAVPRTLVIALGLLGLGCDRPKDAAPSPAAADGQAADRAADPASAATSEAAVATDEPESQAEPEPVTPSRSAADALEDALPDGAPSPAGAELADVEARAWTHYRAREFYEAGEAFATLTKLDRTAWKHPYNAACAATQWRDYERAQVFLIEAFRRGGEEARSKADRDDDLEGMRAMSWWATLRAADDAALTAWTIRSGARSLVAYRPGESPLAIHYIEMSTAAGSFSEESARSSVKLEVEKTKAEPNVHTFLLRATCKLDDRYMGSTSVLGVDDKLLGAGRKQTFDLNPHQDLSWPHKQLFDHCELQVVGLNTDVFGEDRLVAEHCWVGGRIDPGPCAGFQRTPAAEPFIRELVAKLEPPFPNAKLRQLLVFFEVNVGPGPRRNEGHRMAYDCEVGGKRVQGSSIAMYPAFYDLLVAGESTQGGARVSLEGEPTRCQLELVRDCCGPKSPARFGPYCYTATGVSAGPCRWDSQ